MGYHLKILNADDFAGNLEGLDRMIKCGAIDGVIFPQTDLVRLEFNINWESVAGSIIGFRLDYPPFHRVCVDAFAIITQVMKILRDRGYRRIGLALTPSRDSLVNHVWIGSALAFQHSVFRRKDIVPPLRISVGDFDRFKKWFDRYRPEAIVQCQKSIRFTTPTQYVRMIPVSLFFSPCGLFGRASASAIFFLSSTQDLQTHAASRRPTQNPHENHPLSRSARPYPHRL